MAEIEQKFAQLTSQNSSPPAIQSSPKASQSISELQSEGLRVHNEYRARHGVPPLTLDASLCKYAEEWARNLASRGVMQHRSNNKYGENLYCKYGSVGTDATAQEATKSWYDEIKMYNFGCPGFSGSTGHFTQVVWRESQRLGIAKATNSKGQVFIVANYDPPGNFMGKFPENVPKVGVAPAKKDPKKGENEPKKATKVPAKNQGSFSTFDIDCLEAHNKYRKQHGAPPLTLSKSLCDFATEWAKHLAGRGTMQHRSNNKFGENLYAKWGSGQLVVKGGDAVDSWYDEIKLYNFNRPGFASGTGHFTQVVWAGSTELGIGYAEKNGAVFVVANYNPPGNVQGQFPANVRPKQR